MDKLTLEGLMDRVREYGSTAGAGPTQEEVRDYAARLIEQAAQEAMSDEDAEILKAVHRELDEGDGGNAPGHGHDIPGIWDSDNGELAGKPCAWCLTWKKFTAILASKKETP